MHRGAQKCALDELRNKAADRLRKAEEGLARALGQDAKTGKQGKKLPAAAAKETEAGESR